MALQCQQYYYNLYSTTVVCPALSDPENGAISIVPGTNLLTLGLGSVATYSCNTGFALVGQTTRVCEDTNGGNVTTGTWSESAPTCQGNVLSSHNTKLYLTVMLNVHYNYFITLILSLKQKFTVQSCQYKTMEQSATCMYLTIYKTLVLDQ